MKSRAEELFLRLSDRTDGLSAIKSLVGQTEDVHLDCKEWHPEKDRDVQRLFAKAACGLTNAEGGVILIGMTARPGTKDEADTIQGAAPLPNTSAVKARVLDLLGQLVEPGIENIEVAEVNDPPGDCSGFVVVYVPPSDGTPRRSRADWKFYQRIGSGTFPMEYFQIEERFGKGPKAKLDLSLEFKKIGNLPTDPTKAVRYFEIGLVNRGRGIAKFPSIRFKRSSPLNVYDFGIDGNGSHGLPWRPSDGRWSIFRGGVDDVIYPEHTHPVTTLWQAGQGDDEPYNYAKGILTGERAVIWLFPEFDFECEISCEGSRTVTCRKRIPEESRIIPVRIR